MALPTVPEGPLHGDVRAQINSNFTNLDTRLIARENSITVKSIADLPTPIANEIILTHENYLFVGTIDLGGNTLVVDSVDVRICGQGAGFTTILEDAVDAIHIKSGSLVMENILMTDGMTKVANGINIEATGAIIAQSVVFVGFNVSIKETEAGLSSINSCVFTGPNTAIQLNGTSTNVALIVLCDIQDYTNYGIEFVSGAVLDQVILDSTKFSSASVPSYAISGQVSSANISLRSVVSGCTFNGDGGGLENITIKDIRWEFTNCYGIFNSTSYGLLDFTNPALNNTTIPGGDAWATIAAVGAAWNLETSSARFDMQNVKELNYTGTNKIVGEIIYEVSATTSTGTTNNYELGVSVDGATPAADTIVPITILNSGRIASWSFPQNFDTLNQTWELQIRGIGTTTPVIFKAGHLKAKRV